MGLWALVSSSYRHRSVARSLDRRGVVLATCQRTEVYGSGPLPIGLNEFDRLVEAEAARHLLRVGAGLESAVLGEDEILHQVRMALASSRPEGLSTEVRRLFETAISTGRRARAARNVTVRGLAANAVDWLAARSDLSSAPVLVVGAGEMGARLAAIVRSLGAQVIIASRTLERATRLAGKISARSTRLDAAADLAMVCSGVMVALGGPWHQLTRAPVCPIVDMSAPPAIREEVRARLANRLLAVDDLISMSRSRPDAESGAYRQRAEALVANALVEYLAWLRERRLRLERAVA